MAAPHVRKRRWIRDQRLRSLGYASYEDYLRGVHWARVKYRYRESDLPQVCDLCGEEEVDLHHTTYERIGAEELTDLLPLCRNCHQMVHVLERRGELGLDLAGLEDEERAIAYAAHQKPRKERATVEFTAGDYEELDEFHQIRKEFGRFLVRSWREKCADEGVDPSTTDSFASTIRFALRHLDKLEDKFADKRRLTLTWQHLERRRDLKKIVAYAASA